MSSARQAYQEIELARRVQNLCADGQYNLAAVEIERTYDTMEEAADLFSRLRDKLSDEEYNEVRSMVTALLE